MATQIQLRRDTAAAWTAANPILASGEIGIETDTVVDAGGARIVKCKIGDGTLTWNAIPFTLLGVPLTIPNVAGLTDALSAKADLVGGVIPAAQIPAMAISEFLGEATDAFDMIALVGQRGDWCIRTDEGITYILATDDPTIKENWIGISFPIHSHEISGVIGLSAELLAKKGLSSVRCFKTTTNLTSTSTTRVDVPELDIPVIAGKVYKIEVFGSMQSAAVSTGCSLGFYLSAGSGTINGIARGLVSTAASANAIDAFINVITTTAGAAGSFFTTTGVGAINTPHGLGGTFYFECVASGNIKIQFGSEVGGSSSTLLAGSTIVVDQLN